MYNVIFISNPLKKYFLYKILKTFTIRTVSYLQTLNSGVNSGEKFLCLYIKYMYISYKT